MSLIAAGVAVVGFAAVIFGRYRFRKMEESAANKLADVGNVPNDVSSVSSDNASFRSELRNIAGNFESMYEELYSIRMTKVSSYDRMPLVRVMTEWDQKIKANSQGPTREIWTINLRKYFGNTWSVECAKNDPGVVKRFLDAWYDQLHCAGVRRDEHRNVIVKDYSVHNRYIINEIYRIGDQLTVEKPCWVIDGKCIERGIASVA